MKLDAYEKELLELDESGKISLDQSDETEKSALMSALAKLYKKTNESISACLVVIYFPSNEKQTALVCLIRP